MSVSARLTSHYSDLILKVSELSNFNGKAMLQAPGLTQAGQCVALGSREQRAEDVKSFQLLLASTFPHLKSE